MEREPDFLSELARVVCKNTNLEWSHPKHLGCLGYTLDMDKINIFCVSRVERIDIDLDEDEGVIVVVSIIDSVGNCYESINFKLEVLDPEIVEEFAISKYLELLEKEKNQLLKTMRGLTIAIDAAKGK